MKTDQILSSHRGVPAPSRDLLPTQGPACDPVELKASPGDFVRHPLGDPASSRAVSRLSARGRRLELPETESATSPDRRRSESAGRDTATGAGDGVRRLLGLSFDARSEALRGRIDAAFVESNSPKSPGTRLSKDVPRLGDARQLAPIGPRGCSRGQGVSSSTHLPRGAAMRERQLYG